MDQTEQPAQQLSWLDVVSDQVSSLRFGHVQITVHNGRVVQVETTARFRFNRPGPDPETESSR